MATEEQFYQRAEEWLDRVLELNPVAATQLGEHRYDDRLSDNTMEGLEESHAEMRRALSEFQEMDAVDFSLDARIDHTLMIQLLKSFVRDFEKRQGHLRNPGQYLGQAFSGTFMLIMKDFAPLPKRLNLALSRMREIPRVLEEGQANIIAEEVPPVWIETTLQQAQQAPGLFQMLLPSMAAQAAPDIQEEMTQAGKAAVQAIQEYADFLEKEVLPNAGGDFATGEGLFNEILQEEHMVDYDADELLETGWEQFRDTQRQMEELAQEIDPTKSVDQILEEAKSNHPSAEGLLDAYREAMSAARQYVIDHEIASIPEGEELNIIETPAYLRPIIPYAAYLPPGALEEKQKGLFFVTPVESDAPEEQRDQKLRGHYFAKLPITALHEAYPGHHLQLVWANRQDSVVRRLGSYLATLFIEGWAFYCEELMEQLGYIDQPIQRLGRLSDQLWRAGRIIIDVSLHTRGMTVDEAIDFLVEKCRLEEDDARAEVRRYTNSPTQPQSYLMGKLAILDLVDEYEKNHPDASLQEIHDAILGCGSLPPRLMRQRLLS